MKTRVFCLVLLLIFVGKSNYTLAQEADCETIVTVGKPVLFPDEKMFGSAWKPRLGFSYFTCGENTEMRMSLFVIDPHNYKSFDCNSRLLIKFEDDSKHTVSRYCFFPPSKVYRNEVNRYGVTHFYTVSVAFDIDEDVIKKISEGLKITKIRIVFTNGDIKDYDIDAKYQKKFVTKLNECYNQTVSENEQRRKNLNDDDF